MMVVVWVIGGPGPIRVRASRRRVVLFVYRFDGRKELGAGQAKAQFRELRSRIFKRGIDFGTSPTKTH
jgi:hypothetical protein